jgi:hypothetical protein
LLQARTLLLLSLTLLLLLLLLLLGCRSACHFMSEYCGACQRLAAVYAYVHHWLCFSAAQTALCAGQPFRLLQMMRD